MSHIVRAQLLLPSDTPTRKEFTMPATSQRPKREKTKKTEAKVEAIELLAPAARSLIFISHDTRDAELAEAFSKLLSSVSAGVLKTFRSSDRKGSQGIEYGQEWYPELMRNLNLASDVVCLLTQRSLERPWILYEAGVAKGKLDTQGYGNCARNSFEPCFNWSVRSISELRGY
jgi:hypothetical protein